MTVVVAHVPVEEVVVVPANNARVRPNPDEATVDMLGGDGVKGAPDIKEGGQAMGPGINVAFNIVYKRRGRSFGRAITTEPVLLGVEGAEPETLVDVLLTWLFLGKRRHAQGSQIFINRCRLSKIRYFTNWTFPHDQNECEQAPT